MNCNVLFIDDAKREDGIQLYTRIRINKPSDSNRKYEQNDFDEALDIIEDVSNDEEDIIKKFQAEKYGSKDIQEPSWIQLASCDEDLANNFLEANITNDSVKDSDEELSVDILYPCNDGEFKQFHGKYELSKIKLLGILQNMPLGMKIKWIKSLLLGEKYQSDNHSIVFDTKKDLFVFKVRWRHNGIFKTVMELKLEETKVEMNSNLLTDLSMLKTRENNFKVKEMKWSKDKAALIKCILKLCDLSTIKDLSRVIQTNVDDYEQLKSALDNVDLIKYKKNNPFSELDELKFKTDELFKVVIPNFYVPIIQKLQKRVVELKSVSPINKRERDSDQSTIESDDDRHVEKKLHVEDSSSSEEGEILSEETQLSD